MSTENVTLRVESKRLYHLVHPAQSVKGIGHPSPVRA